MEDKNLNLERKKIEQIDLKILELFQERLICVLNIAEIKKNNLLEIEDFKREDYLFKKLKVKSRSEFLAYNVSLFEAIFKISKKIQLVKFNR